MSIKSALADTLEKLLRPAKEGLKLSDGERVEISNIRELLRASTCEEVVTPDPNGSSENLTRVLSSSIGATNYQTLELTEKGRGILSGVLYDMGRLHEIHRGIHGSISMDHILVDAYTTWEGRKKWRGRLVSLECNRYSDGAVKSRKMAEDFVMLADAIQDIFDLAGEKELPEELKHLLDVMRTSATKKPSRGLIYCHPCTMSVMQKQSIIWCLPVYCKRWMHLDQREIASCVVEDWESTLMNLPISTYKTLWETLVNDLKPPPNKRGALPQCGLLKPMELLAYYNCAFEHDKTISLEDKVKTMYILFPNFLCNFIEANSGNSGVKSAAYCEPFSDWTEDRISRKLESDWPL